MVKRLGRIIAVVFLFLGLSLWIYWLTPLHSDDFFYAIQKINYNDKLYHYNTWSGRVVSDITSSFILGFRNHTLTSILGATSFMVLLTCIAALPFGERMQLSRLRDELDQTFFNQMPINLCLVVFFYWLFQPALGQTTFWTVGSVNYMWTNMWIAVYTLLLLQYYYHNRFFYLLPIVAFFAGCSNENTTPIVVAFSFLLVLLRIWETKRLDHRIAISAVMNLLGALLLLLSPGNSERMKEVAPTWHQVTQHQRWQNYINSFDEKYWYYLKEPFLIVLILLLLCFIFMNVRLFKNKKLTTFALAILFLLASLASDFAMYQAPVYPERALSGPLFFLLVSFSLTLYNFNPLYRSNRKIKWVGILVFIYYGYLFTAQYFGQILPLYSNFHEQHANQLQLIEEAKEDDKEEVIIPKITLDPNFPKRLWIDNYVNTASLSTYYNIKVIPISVDLVSLNTGSSILLARDVSMFHSGGLEELSLVKDDQNAVFTLVFSEKEIADLPANYRLYFHITDNAEKVHNYDIGEVSPTLIDNKHKIIIKTSIAMQNLSQIQWGYFDKDDFTKRYTEHQLTLHQPLQ